MQLWFELKKTLFYGGVNVRTKRRCPHLSGLLSALRLQAGRPSGPWWCPRWPKASSTPLWTWAARTSTTPAWNKPRWTTWGSWRRRAVRTRPACGPSASNRSCRYDERFSSTVCNKKKSFQCLISFISFFICKEFMKRRFRAILSNKKL